LQIHEQPLKNRAKTKEIDNMDLLIQWLLFVCGEDDPIIAEPQSGG